MSSKSGPMKAAHHHVRRRKRGIVSFADLNLPENTSIIELEGNKITSFDGFPNREFANLHLLNLEGNPIRSFKGAVPLAGLKWISLRFTPLSLCQHLKLMCLIVFGNQIATINNEPVTNQMRATANVLRPMCFEQLQNGMLLHSLNPVKFVSPKHRTRRVHLNPGSVAVICENILKGDSSIQRQTTIRFLDRIKLMREKYGIPESDRFEPLNDDSFESEASFQGRRLKRIVLPKCSPIAPDESYYSYNEEGDRPDSRAISTSSISSYSGRERYSSTSSSYDSDDEYVTDSDRQSYDTTTTT